MVVIYRTISESDIAQFDKEITTMLGNGWKCHGGLCVTEHKDQLTYSQALILEGEVRYA